MRLALIKIGATKALNREGQLIASRITRRSAIAGMLSCTGLTVGSARAWAQAGPIKIGAIETISGPFEIVGSSAVVGARIAIKQANDAGGINGRQIEYEVRDTRATGDGAVAGLRDLAGSNINLFHGELLSGGTVAAVPIVPSLDAVYVAGTTTAIQMTHDLYNRNCFRAGQNAYMQFLGEASALAKLAPDARRWGCIVADTSGNLLGQEFLYFGLKTAYRKLGKEIELMPPVHAKVGAPDYRNQMAELASQKLDGLLISDTGNEAITILKQGVAFALYKNLKAMGDMTFNAASGDAMKKDTPMNYISTATWYYPSFRQYPMVDDFYKQAVQATKTELFSPFVPEAHLAVTTIIEGVRRAGSTKTEDVIKAIETMKYETIYGPMEFRVEDHQLHFNPGYVRMGPADNAVGWKIEEFVQTKWQDAIEPASPGKAFELPKI